MVQDGFPSLKYADGVAELKDVEGIATLEAVIKFASAKTGVEMPDALEAGEKALEVLQAPAKAEAKKKRLEDEERGKKEYAAKKAAGMPAAPSWLRLTPRLYPLACALHAHARMHSHSHTAPGKKLFKIISIDADTIQIVEHEDWKCVPYRLCACARSNCCALVFQEIPGQIQGGVLFLRLTWTRAHYPPPTTGHVGNLRQHVRVRRTKHGCDERIGLAVRGWGKSHLGGYQL